MKWYRRQKYQNYNNRLIRFGKGTKIKKQKGRNRTYLYHMELLAQMPPLPLLVSHLTVALNIQQDGGLCLVKPYYQNEMIVEN